MARVLQRIGALILLLAAMGLAWHGQPTPEQKWEFLMPQYQGRLDRREVYIDPAELLSVIHDDYISLLILDVRSEADWNIFRIKDSERTTLEQIDRQGKRFIALPNNSVLVVVSNDESAATEAWKHVMAVSHANAYILEGGINNWLDVYGYEETPRHSQRDWPNDGNDESLRHHFRLALGARHPASSPDPHLVPRRDYQTKVQLIQKVIKKGGCG